MRSWVNLLHHAIVEGLGRSSKAIVGLKWVDLHPWDLEQTHGCQEERGGLAAALHVEVDHTPTIQTGDDRKPEQGPRFAKIRLPKDQSMQFEHSWWETQFTTDDPWV